MNIDRITVSAVMRYMAPASQRRSRIGPLQAIPAVLEQLGRESTPLLSRVGLARCGFASAETRISNYDAGRLLHLCAELTGHEHFGLLVGKNAGLASLGILGSLAGHAPDVGTALRTIDRFLHWNNTAAIATLSEHGALAVWSYAIYQPGLVGADQNYQAASAVACNILRHLCGREWAPREVLFPCRRPRDSQPFRSFYRGPIRFDAEHLSLVFDRSWLSHRISGANPMLHENLMQRAATVETPIDATLPDVVRRVVRRLMLAEKASMKAVAAILSMHRRTLDRRLDAHGVSFHDLVEEVSFAVSQQLLRNTEMSIADVANALHYGHQGAFATAFRRWSGATPSKWRIRAARNDMDLAFARQELPHVPSDDLDVGEMQTDPLFRPLSAGDRY